MAYEVKALSLGGVLDQAIALVKDHLAPLFLLTAILLAPITLPAQLLVANAQSKVPSTGTSLQDVLLRQVKVNEELQSYSTLLLVLNLCMVLIYPLLNSALIQGVANAYLGKPVAVVPLILSAFSRIVPLLWTWFLVGLTIMGGFILLIIPGILAAFWFTLATQVVVIEKLRGFQALQRSRAIMKGNIGSFIALALVVGVINAGLAIGASFIPQPHLAAVAQCVASIVTSVFGSAAIVVFYFSCRCRNENYDLQLLAQEVGAIAVETPPEV